MAELFFKYKFFIYFGAGGVLLLSVFLLFFSNTNSIQYDENETEETLNDKNMELEENDLPDETENEYIYVEVKGAVKHPDVYKIARDARVKDALILAKVLKQADLKTVNQSEKLKDEMSIYVPENGEEVIQNDSTDTANQLSVNINTAKKEELTTLNGIGEKKAESIITYREENGLFDKIEDIMNISGIGDKTFENLKDNIEI